MSNSKDDLTKRLLHVCRAARHVNVNEVPKTVLQGVGRAIGHIDGGYLQAAEEELDQLEQWSSYWHAVGKKAAEPIVIDPEEGIYEMMENMDIDEKIAWLASPKTFIIHDDPE